MTTSSRSKAARAQQAGLFQGSVPRMVGVARGIVLFLLTALVIGGAVGYCLGNRDTEPSADVTQMMDQARESASAAAHSAADAASSAEDAASNAADSAEAVGDALATQTDSSAGEATDSASQTAEQAAKSQSLGEPDTSVGEIAEPPSAPPAPSAADSAASEPLATPAPAQASPASETITVKPGEYLYSIAKRIYGDASKWRLIYDANRDQLSNPDAVRVGMKLVVPAATKHG